MHEDPARAEPPAADTDDPHHASPRTTHWERIAVFLGLFALLSLVFVVAVQPGWLDIRPFSPLLDTPWWLALIILTGGVLFAVGVARTDHRAAWVSSLFLLAGAAVTAVLAVILDTAQDAATGSALLAGALACLAAAALTAALSVPRLTWYAIITPPRTALAYGWRPATAVAVSGVLLGGLLGAGAGAGAEPVQRALHHEEEDEQSEPHTVNATSEPLTDIFSREDPDYSTSWLNDTDDTSVGRNNPAGALSWQETLDGPVELADCVASPTTDTDLAGERSQDKEYHFTQKDEDHTRDTLYSTLVTLHGYRSAAEAEESGDPGNGSPADQSVIGLDPATGDELWRYTVHADQPYRIGQVAVGSECDVLVVIDPGILISLSSLTGDIRGTTPLPTRLSPPTDGVYDEKQRAADLARLTELRNFPWRFVTAQQEEDPTGMVRLSPSDIAVLESIGTLATVRRYDATILNYDERAGGAASPSCQHLAEHTGGETLVLAYGCDRPRLFWLRPQGLSIPYSGLTYEGYFAGLNSDSWEGDTDLDSVLGSKAVEIPDLGCWEEEHLGWENLDFNWIRTGFLGVPEVSGGCRWDEIHAPGEEPEPPPEDAGDRLVTLEREPSPSRKDEVYPVSGPFASTPTPVADGIMGEMLFHVHDGIAHLRSSPEKDIHGSFEDPAGEYLVAVDQLDSSFHYDLALSWYSSVTAVTADGSVVFHRFLDTSYEGAEPPSQDAEPITDKIFSEPVGRSEVARGACDGARDIRADRATETVLLFCTTGSPVDGTEQTEVTALTDGDGFEPHEDSTAEGSEE